MLWFLKYEKFSINHARRYAAPSDDGKVVSSSELIVLGEILREDLFCNRYEQMCAALTCFGYAKILQEKNCAELVSQCSVA